jgi:hypothetical protein
MESLPMVSGVVSGRTNALSKRIVFFTASVAGSLPLKNRMRHRYRDQPATRKVVLTSSFGPFVIGEGVEQ